MKRSFVVEPVFIRTEFNYDRDAASDASGLLCLDPSRTVQDFAETDINEIVKKFGLTGKLPQDVRMPEYGDFEGVADFHTALNLVIEAEDAFMRFPADVRARFHHDPAALIEFVSKEENREEAVKLGLVVPPKVPEAILVEVKGGGKPPLEKEPVKGSKEAPEGP